MEENNFPPYQISGFDNRKVWQVVIRSKDSKEIESMYAWAKKFLAEINEEYAKEDELSKMGSFSDSLGGSEHDCKTCGWKTEFKEGISMKTGKPRKWKAYACLNPGCGKMEWQ